MIRQLITLPLRTTWRGAELLFEGASRALSLAVELTGRSGGGPAGDRSGQPDPAAARARQPASATSQNGSAQTPDSSAQRRSPEAPPRPPAQRRSPEAPRRPPARPVEPAEPVEPVEPVEPPPESLAPDEPEPVHIEFEPELVAETADPGAADGAGAELRIDEPWPGYQRLNADEIIDRLTTASAAELAVMELYEATHKRRRTVLSALQRQLTDQARNGPADRSEG